MLAAMTAMARIEHAVDQPQDRAGEIHAQHGQGQILRALAANLDELRPERQRRRERAAKTDDQTPGGY